MTDRDELRVAKALQGIEFPTTKDDLVAYARERGATDKTVHALQAVPAGTYTNKDEVEQAIPQDLR